MTETKVFNINISESDISLPSDSIYRQSSFDRCTIRLNPSSILPLSCHMEDCIFILEDGLQLEVFARELQGSCGNNTYYNCSVIVDGVKRDLKEAVYSAIMTAAGFES